MQTIVVRQAIAEDLETLNRFQQGVIATERPFDPTIRDSPVQYYDIARMLESDDVRFVIAESDAGVVGCGYARIETAKPYLKHRMHGYLGLMYVDSGYRGQSVIGKIIDALKHWCRSRGISELRLEVYSDNAAAIRAYHKAGFRHLSLEMRLGLPDAGT
jgi:ribosomal protein S18 acetylase RimI-like enzyme